MKKSLSLTGRALAAAVILTATSLAQGQSQMIETPQAIINQRGEIALHSLIDAAEGRCGSVHFGVYDYTASCGITAAYQAMRHPACDFE